MRTYSFSRISSYLRCPMKARLRYVDHVPPEKTSLALPLGSAIHDIVMYSVRNPEADHGHLHASLREFLTSRLDEAEAPVDLNGQSLQGIQDQVQAMFDAYMQDPLTGVTSIEESFEIPMGDDLALQGYIDFLKGDRVVELKTSGRSYSQKQVTLNLQATCYAAALIQTMGLESVSVEFFIITKTKVPKVQRLSTVRTVDDLELLKSVVRNVDRGFQEGVFPRNMGVQSCSGCEYQGACLKTAVPV